MTHKKHCLKGTPLALVENLIARTSDHGSVRTVSAKRRNRKSCLDPFKNVILEKFSLEWSFERIADYLSAKYGLKKVNRSTMKHRIDLYLGRKK